MTEQQKENWIKAAQTADLLLGDLRAIRRESNDETEARLDDMVVDVVRMKHLLEVMAK